MGVGAGLYMYDVVVEKFLFAISSPNQFLYKRSPKNCFKLEIWANAQRDDRPAEYRGDRGTVEHGVQWNFWIIFLECAVCLVIFYRATLC